MIGDQEAYALAADIVASVPDAEKFRGMSDDSALEWLGKLGALADEIGSSQHRADYSSAVNSLTSGITPARIEGSRRLRLLAIGLKARCELKVPAIARAAFIPVGAAFDGLAALASILARARQSVVLIDPYIEHSAINRLAPFVAEGVPFCCLTDEASIKPTLQPSASAWREQYGQTRPIEVRATPARALHDRAIIVDWSDAWSVSQSFKDLADRSPALLQPVASDVQQLKIDAYSALWATGRVIV